jgi:hypothetical protein
MDSGSGRNHGVVSENQQHTEYLLIAKTPLKEQETLDIVSLRTPGAFSRGAAISSLARTLFRIRVVPDSEETAIPRHGSAQALK